MWFLRRIERILLWLEGVVGRAEDGAIVELILNLFVFYCRRSFVVVSSG